MNAYKRSLILPPGLVCFIIAFFIAGVISEKHLFAIGIPLTYLLIKLRDYLEERYCIIKKTGS